MKAEASRPFSSPLLVRSADEELEQLSFTTTRRPFVGC
jgi:hypothetical protein